MATGSIKSAPKSESEWDNIYGDYCRARIVNGIVFLKGYSNGSKTIGGSTSAYTALTTLPAKYRPSVDWFCPVGWGGSTLGMRIAASTGSVEFTGNSTLYWNFSTCYPAKN